MDHTLSKRRKPAGDGKAEQKSKLLHAVNGVAEILLTADEKQFESSLRRAMALVARALRVDRVFIWQNKLKNGVLHYEQQFEWLSGAEPKRRLISSKIGFSYTESIPAWEEKFLKGECVNGPLRSLSEIERARLAPYGIQSILVVPVRLRDMPWGFVSFDDCHRERSFTKDEISILRSANLMLASALDRHESESRMREADEHTKLMLDATPLCCSLWDRQYNIIDCNEAVVKLFGLKNKREFMSRFYELCPAYQPDGQSSRQKAVECVSSVFRDGKTMVLEWMHQMQSGERMPMEVTLVRVKRGDEFIVAGYNRDLREYKKMMQSMEHKDTLLHTVNEVASILLRSEMNEFEGNLRRCMGMMAESVHADRMYIWKNHVRDGRLYSTQLYEWSESAAPQQGGAYTTDIPYGEALPEWNEKLPKGQCVNKIVRDLSPGERAHLHAQGVLSILVVPVFLRDQYWGFIGFDDCHSERLFTADEESILHSGSLLIANALLRNEMTHEIQDAVAQAQAASKAKSAFLAQMSHEIRTPMNVIAGMTEIILQENVPKELYEHVLGIKHASASMLSLINDVLDFSKIEAGNVSIVPIAYSLTSLINNVLTLTRLKVREKPVLLTANIDCRIPNWLIGDETRIRQILLNVLDNAAKYTASGFISLTVTGDVQEDVVRLTAEVSDSGPGIQAEDMESLFDDFMRFDRERHKGVQGTGLGLPITKRLCDAMGGSISVRSEYGAGSTFIIQIPQKIKTHDGTFASVSNPEAKRVLLYETSHIYAESMMRSLSDLGVRYTLVKTREEFDRELQHGFYPFVFISSMLFESVEERIKPPAGNTTVVFIMEFGDTRDMRGFRTLTTPVHAASIANVLNEIEDDGASGERGPAHARFTAPTAHVLVVDDLPTNLHVAKGLLKPYQMHIDICESGEMALELVRKKQYDMIFMDHMMPGMDGIEATRRIRALPYGGGYYGNVPIIALTANAVSGVKDMFLQSGMDDFLSKPIDTAKLHSLLRKWIPGRKKIKAENNPCAAPDAARAAPFQMEGVDVKAGIAMAGGTADAYLKILAIFHVDGLDKIEKIRACVEKDDTRLYGTYVHALKSAAANIGAQELSDLFRSLEMAALREDGAFIRRNTQRALEALEALLKAIRPLLASPRGGSQKESSPALLRGALLKLRSALCEGDAGDIADALEQLETMKWEPQAGDAMEELKRSVLFINYTGAILLVDALLRNQ